jgi:hypothetical protein
MPESGNREKSGLTLEQLLKFKRSERPPPAFWEDFDRDLRRRQLAAFVMVRPWYVKLGHAFMAVLRRSAPVGAAAAALAAGVVAWDIREHPAPIVQVVEVDPDSRPVLLPEERFGSALDNGSARVALSTMAAGIRPRARYIVKELAYSQTSQGAYVMDASPVTLSLSDRGAGAHQVMTLSMSKSVLLSGPKSSAEGL